MAFHDVKSLLQIYFFFVVVVVVVVFPILFLVSRRSFTLVADYLVILVNYIIIINFTIIVLVCLGQDASLRTVAPVLQGNVLPKLRPDAFPTCHNVTSCSSKPAFLSALDKYFLPDKFNFGLS